MDHLQNLLSMLRTTETFPGENAGIVKAADTPGCDIHEHLPTLIEYGSKVQTITEMGVRFGFSTRAFLYSRPKTLHSIDVCEWNSIEHAGLDPRQNNYWYNYYRSAYSGTTEFTYQIADTTKIAPIPETDLLFIDTFHHKDVLEIELAKHGNKAQKFIILHDTSTFGECGQADKAGIFVDHDTTNEPGTGLWHAINPFLEQNPHWSSEVIFIHNNGLTVLKRVQ